MHWRDVTSTGTPLKWAGLDLTVERGDCARGAPPWRIELARATRFGYESRWPLRVTSRGAVRAWLTLAPYRQRLAWLRAESPRGELGAVIAPLDADAVRAAGDPRDRRAWYAHWARHFAQALRTSPDSPLYPGRWRITPVCDALERDVIDEALGWDPTTNVVPRWTRPFTAPGFWQEAGADRTGVSGGGFPLPLRAPSPVTAARVKSFRKLARAGTLPPVLFFVALPTRTLFVLDGHDRIVAAGAEKRRVPMLALWAVREHPREAPEPERRDALIAQAERGVTPGSRYRRRLTRDEFNALYIEAYDDRPSLEPVTRAWPMPGGLARWNAEVTARLAAVPEPLRRAFADETA